MEKLLELMNDYAHTYADHYDDTGEEIEIKFLEHTDNCFIYYCNGKFDGLVDDVVISKRFEFIEWLVKNNKIDLGEKLFNLTKNDNRKSIICDLDNNDFSWEDTFLMLLSISSSPIDDLISYLK